MSTILIFGAGKSAIYLIDYLADSCAGGNRQLLVADLDSSLAASKLRGRRNTQAVAVKLEEQDSQIGRAHV